MANLNMSTSPQQNRNIYDGSVAILWDMESCPVPSNICTEEAAGNIRTALQVHPQINGVVTMFFAYGDFERFPRSIREGCQGAGVKCINVPKGTKDSVYKAILLNMFRFALDNRPPAYIMLISGDDNFCDALHLLGERGHTMILGIPSGVGVSCALRNAGNFIWDWPSLPITGHIKKCLSRLDVKDDLIDQRLAASRDELEELLESFFYQIPFNQLERRYQEKFNKSLDYQSLGVSNLEELIVKMDGVAMLIEDQQRKEKHVMSVPMIENRRKLLKRDVIDLLNTYGGQILYSCFERCYKLKFQGEVDYYYCGLTDLEDLCELFKDSLVVGITNCPGVKPTKVITAVEGVINNWFAIPQLI